MTSKLKRLYDEVDNYVGGGGSPADVLEALAKSCFETASHLESSWQDARAARVWDRFGRDFEAKAVKVRTKLREKQN